MSGRSGFAFGPFELDPQRKQLFRDGERLPLPTRSVDMLTALVAHAGEVVTKEQLIEIGWADTAVSDDSLKQAIAGLRRAVGAAYIETQARRGYRFIGAVTRIERRESDAVLDALLAPHRAWIEGRAALETLEGSQIQHAREVFERVLAAAPDQASAHVGLANACIFQFEMTRADAAPDRQALAHAVHHAREACRLDPGYGEAWATLGFVLERTGQPIDGRAALRRAVTLEPDNWRHHMRLSYGSWGEARLRAARRTLALLPDFPMAHWLAATVHVARQSFGEAERELRAGLAAQARQPAAATRFGAVALHWLSGLLRLSAGYEDAALDAFARELADEPHGLLYSRECCANTDYAIGAVHLHRGREAAAALAFQRALARMPHHALARLGLARTHGSAALIAAATAAANPGDDRPPIPAIDGAIVRAAFLTLTDRPDDAAAVVAQALDAAPPGQAGWLLPIEPLLHVQAHRDRWADALARLRARAA